MNQARIDSTNARLDAMTAADFEMIARLDTKLDLYLTD
jgi:hypothetical protein